MLREAGPTHKVVFSKSVLLLPELKYYLYLSMLAHRCFLFEDEDFYWFDQADWQHALLPDLMSTGIESCFDF